MPNPSPVEMLNELIRLGFVTSVTEYSHLIIPTAYRTVPSVTTSGSAPADFKLRQCQAPFLLADGAPQWFNPAADGD